jgi:hypothetical protein
VAVLLSFIPIVGMMSLAFCITGGLWGAVGYLVLRLGQRGRLRLPVMGMLFCGAAVVLCVLINLVFVASASAA